MAAQLMPQAPLRQGQRLVVHIPTPRMRKADKRRLNLKRKASTTVEPLRGSDAPGNNAFIQRVLARCEPRKVKHNRRHTFVEEFLVQWGPEDCSLAETLEQQRLGFTITSILSLDDNVPTSALETTTRAKIQNRATRLEARRPPPNTPCRVQFDPCP